MSTNKVPIKHLQNQAVAVLPSSAPGPPHWTSAATLGQKAHPGIGPAAPGKKTWHSNWGRSSSRSKQNPVEQPQVPAAREDQSYDKKPLGPRLFKDWNPGGHFLNSLGEALLDL